MPSVLDIKYGSISGGYSLEMDNNIIYTKQDFKVCYLVLGDNTSQDPSTIKATVGIPALGSTLYGSYCNKVDPKETDIVTNPMTGVRCGLWEVECEFTSHMRNPSDNNPKVEWGGELNKEAQELDLITGQKITTAAGEPIFTERPVCYPILEVERLEQSFPFDPMVILNYVGKTNSAPFYNFPIGTALMMPILTREETVNNARAVFARYRIIFKVMWNYDGTIQLNTWQGHLLNQGYQYRPAVGAAPVVFYDVHGQPTKVNLKSDGTRLLDSSGSNLKVFASAPGSLNASYGVGDNGSGADPNSQPDNLPHPIAPAASDVGSKMIVTIGGVQTSFNVIGVNSLPGTPNAPRWILDGLPASVGTANLQWQLQRCPNFIDYNRAYSIDFNQLTLGPF